MTTETEMTPEQAEAAAAANSALTALKSAAHVVVHCQRVYDLAPTDENFAAVTAAYARMDEREARLVARLLDHVAAQGLFEGFDRDEAVRCMVASMRDQAMRAAWALVPDARL